MIFPPHTGSVQQFVAPQSGTYKLEVWGAQGGKSTDYPGSNIGNGGYAYGNIYLNSSANLYVCVGGTGNSTLGGYNGGYPALPNGGAGGGATHIATTNRDVLSNYNNFQSEVLIVAGGGGGVDNSSTSGSGGGLTGGNGTAANGGTQTNGGSGGINGSFGKGGITQSNGDYGAAGGGGWYGGGGTPANGGGAGGGSGHVSSSVKGTTIAGDKSFPSPNGGTEIGHRGNGYSVISWIP